MQPSYLLNNTDVEEQNTLDERCTLREVIQPQEASGSTERAREAAQSASATELRHQLHWLPIRAKHQLQNSLR